MADGGLQQAVAKMQAGGVGPAAMSVFSYYYEQLAGGATGLIPESTLRPLGPLPQLADAAVHPRQAREALAATVVIKLNGGLGTSMGMARAKSLLPVRDGLSFLDVAVRQVLAARARYDVALPLVVMNSFHTSSDTMAALQGYPDLPVDGLRLEFLQSQEPKLLADSLLPVTWPTDPRLEWCPPGHGDLYPSLLGSGLLEELIEAGFRYASVTNSDNLGAAPDAALAGWFAASGAPYAAEVCLRTPMDRKGGHLAVRASDGRLILREIAQTPADDLPAFTDEHRHPYFNTNNVWLDLVQVAAVLRASDGVLKLPLIRNTKTVDPTDPSSPRVVQIETAMGSAIEVFEGAQAIAVPRARFLPVKTTNELLLIRSDVYDLDDAGALRLTVPSAPVVRMAPEFYGRIADFEARFADGPPSLRECRSVTVEGDWTFAAGAVLRGDVRLADEGLPRVAAGVISG